jgi:hypothetical protein
VVATPFCGSCILWSVQQIRPELPALIHASGDAEEKALQQLTALDWNTSSECQFTQLVSQSEKEKNFSLLLILIFSFSF